MAIVVMEEMLGGLDEVKDALDRAITVLTDLVKECDPALVPQLPEVLDRTLLQPLTAHSLPWSTSWQRWPSVANPEVQAQQRPHWPLFRLLPAGTSVEGLPQRESIHVYQNDWVVKCSFLIERAHYYFDASASIASSPIYGLALHGSAVGGAL